MKSVVEVAFSGSWFCSSLSKRLRKSLEEMVEDELDEVDEEDAELVAFDVEETVMVRSGSLRPRYPRGEAPVVRHRLKKFVREMKRPPRLIQARIIRAEAFDCSAEFAACGELSLDGARLKRPHVSHQPEEAARSAPSRRTMNRLPQQGRLSFEACMRAHTSGWRVNRPL